jgi:phosphoserine/homoserine phosphotransferase
VVLSDTFYEFAAPLMERLDWPTLFCNRLKVDGEGRVTGCIIRAPDHKRQAVKAFQGLNYKVFAAGDSFNDTRMLEQADRGALFRASEAVVRQFPGFPNYQTYDELKSALIEAMDSWDGEESTIKQ